MFIALCNPFGVKPFALMLTQGARRSAASLGFVV